ncbi:MAG: mRNA interferase MazF [Phycisphaerales bacterium]|jgi:mRNA interferase MazF|nr:mRNA interferase MazF [Phycisphaerales bacterium]
MTPGDVLLIRLQLANATAPKLRPALLLADLPGPYQNLLVCGISTQVQQIVRDWDEVLAPGQPDYAASGVRRASAIRLSYLYAATSGEVAGRIGRIEDQRLHRLRDRLIDRLR